MAVLNFPFNLTPKNRFFIEATASSYIPPGYTSGFRYTTSYTVPSNAKSIITIGASLFPFRQGGTGVIGIGQQRSFVFNEFGAKGDLFVVFADFYANFSGCAGQITVLKNGVTLFDKTFSSGGDVWNALGSAYIQANEFDL